METKFFNKFYLDKEKDIVVELYKNPLRVDELKYIIRTPNHKSGNLIKNLANICDLDVTDDENGLKIIENYVPASINGSLEEVYIFRLAGMKVANIYEDRIEVKAMIPAITKTLMSQTKGYKFDIKKTIVKSYILKKSKFRTDLHTHMNANLTPDTLIALGIVHQLRYPLYYIKKLNLKLSEKQELEIYRKREKVEEEYKYSELVGKKLIRKIDDNVFINFADLILNNIENAQENIMKIRTSLALLKDGQSVFTNLEKVYIYRYVFCKGKEHEEKIKINLNKVERIPEKDIVNRIKTILDDKKPGSQFRKNTLRQDEYLWIAREYESQGIEYVEIADTDLVKVGDVAVEVLEQIHEVMPKIEKETGVKIRFLGALRRIPLTIIKEVETPANYLSDNIAVLKAVSNSPYVVGSDFVGEEINDITNLRPAIKELVQFAVKKPGFTIRIHAGENDCLKENVKKSIECIEEALEPGQKIPNFRLGHGLYTEDLASKDGINLMKKMVDTGAVLEFQLTSNVRLNNLTELDKHPIKTYLDYGVKCVQGTDGCAIYGSNAFDEQLALKNLIGLTDEDFMKMRKVEDEIIAEKNKYFEEQKEKFEKLIEGSSIREKILEIETYYLNEATKNQVKMRINNNIEVEKEEKLKDKIKTLPIDKIPIIIAGGSFNAKGRDTILSKEGKENIKKLVAELDDDKVYFVIGHKMTGYEKAIIDYSRSLNKKFEIDAIIPKEVSVEDKENLINENLDGIRVSTESEEMGIYKSFNYEIFERRNSIVVAFDGNSPVSNLVQEAKNGKGKAKIYVNQDVEALKDKANSLDGYVKKFKIDDDIAKEILDDHPELKNSKK